MSLRYFTTPLLLLLLLSTLSCSKKEDTANPAVAVGTGSYKLNGTTITCQARAYNGSFVTGNQTYTTLEIILVDTPQLQSNTKSLKVSFQKLAGQPNSAYQFDYLIYGVGTGTNTTSATYSNIMATLQEPSSGVFSGTFSGTSPSAGPGAITDGVFTNARL